MSEFQRLENPRKKVPTIGNFSRGARRALREISNRGEVPGELRGLVEALSGPARLSDRAGAGALRFERVGDPGLCEIRWEGKDAVLRYGSTAQAGRGLGALLSGLARPGRVYRERTPFTTLGIMLDCSRNAVMKVGHLRLWLRRLALLGYNRVMIYTEDTYELPGEPWFGYQRGAYTAEELREIVACAARLNIEIIPCIQTLGHLEQILRHPAYREVKDTARVMMVGEPKTYRLIEKMVRRWREVCPTDRIHVGMDETHDLGRGRYMDLHGYRRGFDLFNEHLAKVVAICRRHGFKPMIWSDMYFRLGCRSGGYYDRSTVIPKDVVRAIPQGVELVYWDYEHPDKEFYLDWIARHRAMGREPVMASGIWTWNRYWYDRRITEAHAGACIEACREARLHEIYFTQWGDNGAYCDHDSAFAGMAWCAEKAYGGGDGGTLANRFAGVCGGSYAAHLLAAEIHGGVKGLRPDLWDDPLFETRFRTAMGDDPRRMAAAARSYARIAASLCPHADDRAAGDVGHALCIAQAFADRYALAAALLAAHRKNDRKGFRRAKSLIAGVVESIRAAEESFRAMWMAHNKPEGLETVQGRFGMLEARYREMSRRLSEPGGRLVELDSRCPPA
jgi:hexosaminidase